MALATAPPSTSTTTGAEPLGDPRDPATSAASAGAVLPHDFSMVLGGPLYQLFLRMRIVRQPLDLLARRIVVITMLAWLPLLVLSVAIGRAWGNAKIPFLLDIAAHARFLVSLPLLIIAEWVVHKRVRPLINQFLAREIVPPAEERRGLPQRDRRSDA